MTSYYVWSAAAGAANGTSWANAYTKLATAFSGKSAGDIFYVAQDHSETTAGVTLTAPGSLTLPVYVACADRSGSVPPVAADLRATAIIECSGDNNFIFNGNALYNGIIFNCGTGAGGSSANIIMNNDNNNETLRFDNCSLRFPKTNVGSSLFWSGASSDPRRNGSVELNNTTMSFGHVNCTTVLPPVVRWRNTPSALIGAAVPTVLFTMATSGSIDCEAVDLSAFTGTLCSVGSINSLAFQWRFADCKLNASVTKASASSTIIGNGTAEVNFVRASATGNYEIFKANKAGTLNEETTIVRTGGASDGTTPIAWRIDTSVTANYSVPFDCPQIAFWNNTVGSPVTATVQGIWGGGAVPNDDEIWVEVRYLGDASSPQGTIVSDAKVSILGAAAGQAAGSGTWGGSTTKFALNVTFTPQQKGRVYARVRCAKPSSIFYIDPLATPT